MKAETGYYLAGFADGEGSFNVSFRHRQDYKSPWKISLCFESRAARDWHGWHRSDYRSAYLDRTIDRRFADGRCGNFS